MMLHTSFMKIPAGSWEEWFLHIHGGHFGHVIQMPQLHISLAKEIQ